MADAADTPPNFFARLKQHHIYRVAAWYGATIAVLIQVVARAFPYFGWSAVVPAVIIILIAGFPVAIVLAWLLVKPTDAARQTTWQKRRWKLGAIVTPIVIAAVVVSGIFAFHFSEQRAEHLAATQQAVKATVPVSTTTRTPFSVTAVPDKSVAVLPFLNESGDKDQEYFSDGLSKDLITALSQFSGLKVINRDSSFRFRSSQDSVQVIGEKLGVAHLLEGSVQRAGNEVRISAELVNADDGSTLWSQNYDRSYKNLFALQDAITQAVADALKAKLLDTNNGAVLQSDRPPSGNLDAYNAYQQGAFYARRADAADQRKAMAFYSQAIKLDPNYAQAYASLGLVQVFWADGTVEAGSKRQQANAMARTNIAKALALAPNLALAHAVNGILLTYADYDWVQGLKEMQRALQLAPNNSKFRSELGGAQAAMGEVQKGVDSIRQAISTNPLCGRCYVALEKFLPALGHYNEALAAGRKALNLNPGNLVAAALIAYIHAMQGSAAAALQAARAVQPSNWHNIAMTVAVNASVDHAAADRALQSLIVKSASVDAYQIVEIYALRKQPDEMFNWLERARINHDFGIGQLLSDPPILRYRSDPRFAAFCKKVSLPPTTTDAKALP